MLQRMTIHTLPRTNNSILQLTWVVGVYKIYRSNIECPIIRFTDHQRVMFIVPLKLDRVAIVISHRWGALYFEENSLPDVLYRSDLGHVCWGIYWQHHCQMWRILLCHSPPSLGHPCQGLTIIDHTTVLKHTHTLAKSTHNHRQYF